MQHHDDKTRRVLRLKYREGNNSLDTALVVSERHSIQIRPIQVRS